MQYSIGDITFTYGKYELSMWGVFVAVPDGWQWTAFAYPEDGYHYDKDVASIRWRKFCEAQDFDFVELRDIPLQVGRYKIEITTDIINSIHPIEAGTF